jgi:hydroxycarboxylate dehydrogenase B
MFEAAGCSLTDARTVAEHLVESSLFGHDSHGTLRFYEYIDQILAGTFDAQGQPHVLRERGSTSILDGGGGLGAVAGRLAVERAAALVHAHGVATVTLRNCSHLGRIGAYPLALARQGLLGMAFVNAGRLGRQIPPFGGIDGKLSTNPIAFAAPRADGHPILVDMTTSVVAEGKIRVARNRGLPVPEGWLIDADGLPTTDPNNYLADPQGAILPLGGVVGYKGTCLSMVVEILGGILSGEGCAAGATVMKSNGMLLTAWDPGFFCDTGTYEEELEGLISHLLTSRVDPAVGEIQLPGGPEFRHAADREEFGIPIDDTTWERICERAARMGLDPAPWEAEACHRDGSVMLEDS